MVGSEKRILANTESRRNYMEPTNLNLDSSTLPMKDLLVKFHNGGYQLPAFQRPFVWKIRQTLNLLDSLIRGYPISVIYLWKPGQESTLKPKKMTFSENKIPVVENFEAYVIDGQQRLTSLLAAFGFSEAFDPGNRRSLECWLELEGDDVTDGRLTKLFQSPANKAFLENEESQGSIRRVRLKDLLDKDHQKLRDERREQLKTDKMTPEAMEDALKRIDAAYRMLSTRITCITITGAADKEVLQIFKRLNRGGTGLKERDVKAADLGIGRSVDVLQDIQSFVGKPLPTALGFGFSFAFRALVVFHKGTAQFNSLKSTWADDVGDRGQDLKDSWKEAEHGLIAAMKFVDHLGWSRKPLLPSCNALIPLAYALKKLDGEPNQAEVEILTQWLCLAALRSVFQGSVETTINGYLRKIKEMKNKPLIGLLDGLNSNEKRPITRNEIEEPTTLWGPFSQVMFAWLVAQKAKDWLSGQPLDTVARFALKSKHPEETLSIQHIFPRKLLGHHQSRQPNTAAPTNQTGTNSLTSRI